MKTPGSLDVRRPKTDLRAVSSQIVISPGRNLLGLAVARTEAGGVGHPHHSSHVGRGQPTLLVVVGPRELPAFILEILLVSVVLSCNIDNLIDGVFSLNRERFQNLLC